MAKSVFLFLSIFFFSVVARANPIVTTFYFDDIQAGYQLTTDPMYNYGGLYFNNMYSLNADKYVGNPSGYYNGIVTPPNVVYNAYGNPTSFFNNFNTFTFISADFTAAWNDNLQVNVQGFSNGTLVETANFLVNTSGPTLETFNWGNLNEVLVTTSGGYHSPNVNPNLYGIQVAIDNLTVIPPVPIPAALYFVVPSLMGVFGFLRRKV